MTIAAQQKIYLTLAISMVIIVVLLLLLICPLVDKIKALSAELKDRNDIVSSYEAKSSDYLNWLRDEHTGLESGISKIDKSFVAPERAIDFILTVEQIAALTSNYQEIKEISSAEEKNILSFQISLWGTFPNLIKFLAQLENIDYFIDSSSLQTTRIEERNLNTLADKGITVSAGDVKGILEIKIYAKN